MVERRKYERYDLAVPVKIETLARTAKKRKLTLRTANVSAGGAYFHTDIALTEGTKVRLEMHLSYDARKTFRDPKSALIGVLGTVVRCQQVGIAIRFSEDYVIAPSPAQARGVG